MTRNTYADTYAQAMRTAIELVAAAPSVEAATTTLARVADFWTVMAEQDAAQPDG